MQDFKTVSTRSLEQMCLSFTRQEFSYHCLSIEQRMCGKSCKFK